MQNPSYIPDFETLTAGLISVINEDESERSLVGVLARKPNEYAGKRYVSEIVTCRLDDNRLVQLFIKYEMPGGKGRTELAYEARVYRHILHPLRLSTPKFYGSYTDTRTGATWLVLEYLPDALPLTDIWEPSSIAEAASWLGRFHAANAHPRAVAQPLFLKIYNAEYYLEHAHRALKYSDASPSFSWLHNVWQHLKEFIIPFWNNTAITHGDYYLHNILLRDGMVHPIDWEFAGIDLPEMDLACLTDGLPADTAQQCELAYQKARWTNGCPDILEQSLCAARLCLCFYNLGTRPNWIKEAQGLWYSRQLRSVAEQLGLIGAS